MKNRVEKNKFEQDLSKSYSFLFQTLIYKIYCTYIISDIVIQ